MTVRYDPILASRLAAGIQARWQGAPARDAWIDPGTRLVEIRFRRQGSLVFHLHPDAGHVLAVDRSLERGRRIPLRGLRLAAAASPVDSRQIDLRLGPLDERGRVVRVDLRANRRDARILTGDGQVVATLRRRGAEAPDLRPGRRGAGGPLSREAWLDVLAPAPAAERRAAARRHIAWLSSLNEDFVFGAAGTHPETEADLAAAWDRYVALRAGAGAWTVPRPWGWQPYPHPLGDPAARPASDLLEAMREARRADGLPPPEDGETAGLRVAMERRLRRLEKRRAALRHQLGGGEPEVLRRAGSLLLARRDEVPRGRSRITLKDFEGRAMEVELDPARDAVANAERLFEEARHRERAARRLPGLLRRVEDELGSLRAGLDRLAEEGPDEELWRLAGGRPAAATGAGRSARTDPLPYRRLRSTGGLEIRVGRGASSNDDLTFRHSDPEDIWLHAGGAPGAHVILRWGRRDENPPRQDLLEAAVVAAVNSAARGSGAVAVTWTRRKHVRKPRKSPPGTVRSERVRTLFVEPDPDLVDRLSEG
ncbi:MAG: NFACT RNA binding domain-containing protein [Gemmatimonadota bacterium]